MSSNRTDSRRKSRLSRAEIKAYESRRAEERRRLALHQEKEVESNKSDSTAYVMTRDDEFGVIKSDLLRLGWIVGILVVLLIAATLMLS
ncbi:MAG: hypothetical protein R3A46_04800 [Thermomicrobiales bacterium]